MHKEQSSNRRKTPYHECKHIWKNLHCYNNVFYQKFCDILNHVRAYKEIIIVGDLNAKLGRRQYGQYGEDIINDNGERLIEICKQFDLKICNTFYRTKIFISIHGRDQL